MDAMSASVSELNRRRWLQGWNASGVILMTIFREVIVPDGKQWKRFGPLHVYAPASEYILALKITAGRQKDLDDCAILLLKTQIRTRKQAQQVLDRYILPGGVRMDSGSHRQRHDGRT